jgi:signal transduction histidine kinase
LVEKKYGALPQVECRLPQLNQVFTNLLVNAAHAIPERGIIRVATGVEGHEVWVDIVDSGEACPPS